MNREDDTLLCRYYCTGCGSKLSNRFPQGKRLVDIIEVLYKIY